MTRITVPGVYPDIPEADYHADPCPTPSLSSSIGKELVNRSPWHAWTKHPRLNPEVEPDNRASFDLGSAAHAFMLADKQRFKIIDAEVGIRAGLSTQPHAVCHIPKERDGRVVREPARLGASCGPIFS